MKVQKQRKLVLIKKEKKNRKQYFNNLSINNLSDKMKFWKKYQGIFSNKGLNFNLMMLAEKVVS